MEADPVLEGLAQVAGSLEDVYRYRDLHQHPELSMAEHRTAGVVSDWLRRVGYQRPASIANAEVQFAVARAEGAFLETIERAGGGGPSAASPRSREGSSGCSRGALTLRRTRIHSGSRGRSASGLSLSRLSVSTHSSATA